MLWIYKTPEKVGVTIIETLPSESSECFYYTFPVRLGTDFSADPVTNKMTSTVENLIYSIQASEDLNQFEARMIQLETALSSDLPALNPGWEYVTFRFNSSTDTLDRGFFRVNIDGGNP